ncbi:MAG: GGDEF domain-containing protein [Gammaproteobacteria bacterium]
MERGPTDKTVIISPEKGAFPDKDHQGDACLVQLYGPNKGRRYSLAQPQLVLGRSDSADIEIDQQGVSRLHAEIHVQDGVVNVVDLDSTNGTFVNDESVSQARLSNGDLIRIGQTIFKFLAGSDIEAHYHEEIYRLTTTDALTNTSNKRYFMEYLASEISRAQRYGRVLSLALFDIDHFKRVNDNYGHVAGDYVLRELAALLVANLRSEDLLARYGGEEFAIVLPETNARTAHRVCEKLRGLIETHGFAAGEGGIPITVSLGVTSYQGREGETAITVDDLIGRADGAMYQAKQAGRNRVCVAR